MPTIHKGDVFFQGAGAGTHYQRYTVGFADFTAAALTEALSMTVTHPAGTELHRVSHRLDATFTGGTIATAVIDVGINGGNLDQFVDALNVFTAVVPYGAATGDGTAAVAAVATTTIDVTLTTTVGNVADATTGSYTFDLYFARVDVDPDPIG